MDNSTNIERTGLMEGEFKLTGHGNRRCQMRLPRPCIEVS